MKKLIIIMMVAYGYCMGVIEQDYLYPVASCRDVDGTIQLYLIYQHDHTLELLLWNSATGSANILLPALFYPTYVRSLCDGSGFSFIDNGRIRIKQFKKRSAFSIELSEPLYDIMMGDWIDDYHAYITARYYDKYAIFQCSMSGDVACIVGSPSADYMFPQKIGSELFYIERTYGENSFHYSIKQISYPTLSEYIVKHFNDSETFQARSDALIKSNGLCVKTIAPVMHHNEKKIADFGVRPIIHVQMITTTQGFVLEHVATIDTSARTVQFLCHYIEKKEEIWLCKHIFSFSLPTALIMGELNGIRLYESLFPLLPRHHNGIIVYNDMYDDTVNIFEYILASGTVRMRTQAQAQKHCFVPFSVGIYSWYGGILSHSSNSYGDMMTTAQLPSLYYDYVGMRIYLNTLSMYMGSSNGNDNNR